MFGFGSKFKATSLQSFGKTVADYLHSSGEACLIANPVEDIPLKHEISNKNSESRFIFDLGVMYGLAYINLRDQEQKELKYLNEFIKEGLTYVSKYGFNLEHGPKETFKLLVNIGSGLDDYEDDYPFSKGVVFAGVFLERFYGIQKI
jgi:hypothetical protein|tara:strand:- start:468 stop:908 length:441 start_codon:yes stop_codon:yes gene_type:complete